MAAPVRHTPFFELIGSTVDRRAAGNRFPVPTYVHHLPGRLRFKAAPFRDNPGLLEAARRELIALGGVTSVSTNLVTGSVLVEYDPRVLSPTALCDAMQECGFPAIRQEAPALDTQRQPSLAEAVAGMAARSLFETLAERLFVAAVPAII